jgi:hypothetical protein
MGVSTALKGKEGFKVMNDVLTGFIGMLGVLSCGVKIGERERNREREENCNTPFLGYTPAIYILEQESI